jgi:hypothetical protein
MLGRLLCLLDMHKATPMGVDARHVGVKLGWCTRRGCWRIVVLR